MPDRYLIPLAPFLFIGLNGVLCLFFFLGLDQEIRRINLRWKRQQSNAEELKAQVAQLGVRMLDAEERAGVLVAPTPPRSGLNLNKRTQVIRMSRRGEQAGTIAASLNLPQREVELLLKVHAGVVVYSPADVPSKTVNS
jgi:hypothetical protein